ncbi:MAG: DUF4350 domain-containing protein [Terrimesophilobacter sp.]
MTLTAREVVPTEVITPTIRKSSRKVLYWVIAGISLILIALFAIMINGAGQYAGPSLSPKDPSPRGAKAIAEVLRSHGVTVTTTDGMAQTRVAASGSGNTTVFVLDANGYLTAESWKELAALSSHLIVMSPDFDQLDTVAPELGLGGRVDGILNADCALPFAQRAESMDATGTGFQVVDSSANVTTCFGSGDRVYSIVELMHAGNRVTVIGTQKAFSNEFVLEDGNAAVALGLLGETRNLVWLVPTIDEAPAPGGATLAELTPLWVNAVVILFVIAAIAAGFWRGRRFGPLVVEALPVTVRASETMRGRARLYQKSSDFLHTLDALRMGTIERLAVLCGLPSVATVDEVIRAVAHITQRQSADVANLVRDVSPSNDAQLMALSDELLKLEAAVAAAVRA